MVSLDEVKSYLRIDFDDDDTMLETLINTSDEYLKSAIHSQYDSTSERAKLLSLIVISDLYDNRGVAEKVSGNVRKLVSDFALQLKLEGGGYGVETD